VDVPNQATRNAMAAVMKEEPSGFHITLQYKGEV
jgi:hypothetical protein